MKKVVVNTKRNTNIEILRIIAILLIVISIKLRITYVEGIKRFIDEYQRYYHVSLPL